MILLFLLASLLFSAPETPAGRAERQLVDDFGQLVHAQPGTHAKPYVAGRLADLVEEASWQARARTAHRAHGRLRLRQRPRTERAHAFPPRTERTSLASSQTR